MMYSDDIDMSQDHTINIIDRELDMIILKMGSFLSILENKKTNQAKMLIRLVKDDNFRKCFMEIADVDNFQYLVQCLMEKYPSLCKSKVVTNALKNDKRRRKKSL